MGEAVLRDRVIPLQRSEIIGKSGIGGELEVLKTLMLIVCVVLNSFNITLLIDNQSREQVYTSR